MDLIYGEVNLSWSSSRIIVIMYKMTTQKTSFSNQFR